jgi:hypothetical protein
MDFANAITRGVPGPSHPTYNDPVENPPNGHTPNRMSSQNEAGFYTDKKRFSF